jgi:ABC-type sugar transport system substrate-binding protein
MKRLLGVVLLAAACVGCGDGKLAHRIAFMPKLVDIPYFKACQRGAEEAAKELDLELVYDGTPKADKTQQADLIKQWTASGKYDCLAVACNDPDVVGTALAKARGRGLTVVTYDADAKPDARQFFVNMATYDAVAQAMVDAMAEELGEDGGQVGLLTSWVNAPNQREWAKRIKAYAKEKYPKLTILDEEEHGEDRSAGVSKAKTMIQKNKEMKGIIGLTSVAVPAAAEAVQQEGKKGQIKVTGVSTPRDMRGYLKDGTVKTVILWNPVDLGYLTVYVCDLVRNNKMPEDGTIQAGRLKDIKVTGREVLLGEPMKFTRDNVDQFDF